MSTPKALNTEAQGKRHELRECRATLGYESNESSVEPTIFPRSGTSPRPKQAAADFDLGRRAAPMDTARLGRSCSSFVTQVWLLLGMFYCTSPLPTWAAVLDPIPAAEEALRDTGQPWYDVENDQLRPVQVRAITEEPDRAHWKPSSRPRWNLNWRFSWLGEVIKALAWGILFLLIGLLIYALVQTYLHLAPVRSSVAMATPDGEDSISDEQRIENLPMKLRAPTEDPLSLARQYYDAGDFAEAIVYLFSHRLLQLDKAGLIRLTKGKTNRQYLLELRRVRELEQLLGQTMTVFEDVFFGHHPLERERFEQCWNNNEQFQLMVTRTRG